MEWGEVIRRIRQNKGLTQENLADDMGVNITTIIRWEKQGTLKASQLEKIAKVFKMDPSELYAYHTNPSLLEEPLSYYKATKRVPITVELDGSTNTLNEWINTLRKLNAAL